MSYAGAQPGIDDFVAGDRCTATRFDVRCQLRAGHEAIGPHVAMMRHRSSRREGYTVWTVDGQSSWEFTVGPQYWAPSFPRVA